MSYRIADLFCGAGGTSTGAIEALEALGYRPELTAVNHWPRAIETHTANHPGARHLCACLDSLNPQEVFPDRKLNLLWASPSCVMFSTARVASVPLDDGIRASPWCVVRWADSLRPDLFMVENVPAFRNWGPLDAKGRPIKKRKGETFRAWKVALESLGYKVDHRVFCAADFGDPTTRERVFIQGQRGNRKITWPTQTHAEDPGLFSNLKPWVPASSFIDMDIPMRSIFGRKKPLSPNTLRRIAEGLEKFGGATIIAMEHGGRALPVSKPLPTVTTAKGGAFGLAYLLPQGGGGSLRPITKPAPTVAAAGAIRLIVEYYGNGRAHSIDRPLPTVTTRDRFALIKAEGGDVLFRMVRPRELAAAQGFRSDYKFTGTVQEITKQIGNAVPRNLARALVLAAVGQESDIRKWVLDVEGQ